ncbi:hypothetical protein ACLB2K_008359 [Fragaria x ananassa]
MKHRSTSPPRLRSAKLLSIVRHETDLITTSEEEKAKSYKPEAAPKPAAYYWLRLKLGQLLIPAEKAAVHDYSLEDLLGDNLLFCTICGITQHEEKPEKPSDVWTDSDEEYLRSLSGGFYYMVGLSELKNIHRIMINQHNDIEAVVRAGIQPKCAADYEHRTMKTAMKDEEKDKE